MLRSMSYPHHLLNLPRFRALPICIGLLGIPMAPAPVFADQVVQKFPAGSAESLLKSRVDPEWKRNESSQAGGAIRMQCDNGDGQLIGKDEPGYTECVNQNADETARRKPTPAPAPRYMPRLSQ